MKRCPSCQQTYVDDRLNFCTSDGTPLLAEADPANASRPPHGAPVHSPVQAWPTQPQPNQSAWPQTLIAQQQHAPRLDLGAMWGTGGMGPQISIQLDRPQGPYYPGDSVQVAITLQTQKAWRVRSVGAGLLFLERYTELVQSYERDDQGARMMVTNPARREDSNWLYTQWLSGEGMIPAGFNKVFHFTWAIPSDAPPTYEGSISKLSWLVRVKADVPMEKDLQYDAVVPVIVPPSGEHNLQDSMTRPVNDASDMKISFWLPRVEFVEGETITGRLLIEPRKDIKARAVRLHLERQETVPGGDEENKSTLAEPALQIASQMQLRSGVHVTLDFALTVPHKWRPNHRTSKSQSSNYLNVVIDVPWRGDYTGSQEIYLYNGPSRP
ncbi:MAG: hypothetical protein H0X14_02895 [Acidobacteria bacterium]|nr:hypothetical protein [Acidobacteriota bacterium]